MTKRDIAGYLNIDTKTLYNWKKNKPNLYNVVMKGLAFEEVVKSSKDNYEKLKKIDEKYSNTI